jgi:hypothetical protein
MLLDFLKKTKQWKENNATHNLPSVPRVPRGHFEAMSSSRPSLQKKKVSTRSWQRNKKRTHLPMSKDPKLKFISKENKTANYWQVIWLTPKHYGNYISKKNVNNYFLILLSPPISLNLPFSSFSLGPEATFR